MEVPNWGRSRFRLSFDMKDLQRRVLSRWAIIKISVLHRRIGLNVLTSLGPEGKLGRVFASQVTFVT
jgi:hypothetical protein